MADIFHDFPIRVPPARVFEGITTPEGLDAWWTLGSSGRPVKGAEYRLYFGPEYEWRAKVTRCVRAKEFELKIGQSHADWKGTRVGFRLERRRGGTQVHFYHCGWPKRNEHYRGSTYCWAMYLRILKRHLEQGETVAFDRRLDV